MSSSFDADKCVAQLYERHAPTLRARASAGGSGLFVLIDPLTGDPLVGEPLPADQDAATLNALRSKGWDRACHTLSLPPLLELDAALAPYLVELSGSDDPWLEATLEWALRETVRSWQAPADGQPAHRVGAWLHSAAFGPMLAQKLSGWLALSTRAHTGARYLRLADRRVWGLVLNVLGEAAVAQRLPPVQSWQWIDAHAACCELNAAPAGEASMSDDAALIRFSEAQWALLARGAQAHGHLAQQRGLRLTDPSDNPARWAPVSAAQWRHALQTAGTAKKSPHKNVPQEGNLA
ncbi:MAG: hypothetical protein MUF44_12305 [Hydrogenophaga sp.]|nr:hypothetical protein [Hydrogenophaga sp.]